MQILIPLIIFAAIFYLGYEYIVHDKKPEQVVSETYEYAKKTAGDGKNAILEKNINSKIESANLDLISKNVLCEDDKEYGSLCKIFLISEKGEFSIDFYGAQIFLTEKIGLFDPKKNKLKIVTKGNESSKSGYNSYGATVLYHPNGKTKKITLDITPDDEEVKHFSGVFNLETTDFFDKNILSGSESITNTIKNFDKSKEYIVTIMKNVYLSKDGALLKIKFNSQFDDNNLTRDIETLSEECEKFEYECNSKIGDDDLVVSIKPPYRQTFQEIYEKLVK